MRRSALPLLLVCALAAFPGPAGAAKFKTIYNFCAAANCTDGNLPIGLAMGGDGHIYGTTQKGGRKNGGTIFELVPTLSGKWKEHVIHDFCGEDFCTDGGLPQAGPILDVNGNIYGTGQTGFENDGVIYELTPNRNHKKWTYNILVRGMPGLLTAFTYQGQSTGALYDGSSPLFGTDTSNNAVFALTRTGGAWSVQDLYKFCRQPNCADGNGLTGELALDASGNLFGTTYSGGAHNGGTLYGLSFQSGAWHENVLISFCAAFQCQDGTTPGAGVNLDQAGTLYGTTVGGGRNYEGTLFEYVPSKHQQLILWNFCSIEPCADGARPLSKTIADGAGHVYGTASRQGGHLNDPQDEGGGAVYAFSGSTLTPLYGFCAKAECTDGGYPIGDLVFGPAGTIVGAATIGGTHNGGTIFMIAP